MSVCLRCLPCPKDEVIKERKYQCKWCQWKVTCKLNDEGLISIICAVVILSGALFLIIWGSVDKREGTALFHVVGSILTVIGAGIMGNLAREQVKIKRVAHLLTLEESDSLLLT